MADQSTFLRADGDAVSLNPQPLPPGEAVALNPQPLPPGEEVALNPQPLPPREIQLSDFMESMTRSVLRAIDAHDASVQRAGPRPEPWRQSRIVFGFILEPIQVKAPVNREG